MTSRATKFKVTPSLRIRLTKLSKKIGVTLNWKRKPSDSFQWDGTDIACKEQDASNIIHDIAHWIICTPARRKVEDFGLGPGPDSGESCTTMVLTGKANSDEEEKASALGIWFEKQLNLDWKATADWHSWDWKYRAPRAWRDENYPDLFALWESVLEKEIKKYEAFFRTRSKGSNAGTSGE